MWRSGTWVAKSWWEQEGIDLGEVQAEAEAEVADEGDPE